jgi:hypothetical protein
MKRNILLGFLLIGLVVMEWGCWQACGDQPYHAEGVAIRTMDFNGGGNISGPIKYDSLVFELDVISRALSKELITTNSAVNACDPWFFLENEISRVEVLIDKDYSENIDGINLFANAPNGYLDFGELWTQDSALANSYLVSNDDSFGFGSPGIQRSVLLAFPPNKTDTFQFTFQFFDTEGNVFETTTDPIVITP